jgi:subfamily B ATP-binding cassette protein MsbA
VLNLILTGVVFAFCDGLGLTLLLPVLQFVENPSYQPSGNAIWDTIAKFMDYFNIPVTLISLLIMAFVPIILRQLVYFFNAWYSARVAGRISIRARMKAMDTFYDADPAFYDTVGVGERVNVVMNLSPSAGTAITSIISLATTLLLMMVYFVILLRLSPLVTLCALGAGALVIVVTQRNMHRIGDFSKLIARRTQAMHAKVNDRMGLMRLVKMRDQKLQEKQFIEDYSKNMLKASIKIAVLGAVNDVTAQPLLRLAAFAPLFICVTFLGMGLAQVVLIVYLLTQINARVTQANVQRQAIIVAMANVNLLNETIQVAAQMNTIHRGHRTFEGLKSAIEAVNLKFSYPDAYRPDGALASSGSEVLKNISFKIPAGSFVAFVGRSGAGKSTLVELFARLRDRDKGTFTYDGHDIKEYELGQLRREIGYLTQNAMLFNDTVYSNLTYGLDWTPTDEEIRVALEGAYASFVYSLPQGLETQLGDAGIRFSGGERQRLALARVLLEDTSILILDEPTSALDSESEAYIQEALENLRGVKTVIVIAHRLATVIKADQLFVLQDGELIERGTHAELIEQKGVYTQLFDNQIMPSDGLGGSEFNSDVLNDRMVTAGHTPNRGREVE